MSDQSLIEELETAIQIARDRLRDIEQLESELLANIPTQGFRGATREIDYRIEKQFITEELDKNLVRVAALRR
jgi:hypothetical protein